METIIVINEGGRLNDFLNPVVGQYIMVNNAATRHRQRQRAVSVMAENLWGQGRRTRGGDNKASALV